MKYQGIINTALARALTQLGHTDVVVVADAGLPRPAGVRFVDLAVTFGVPTFEQIVGALADELVVEHAVVAEEMKTANVPAFEVVRRHFGQPGTTDHEQFKADCLRASLIVRTGENTPFANVALVCGVPF
jgi:D-ribose pyranase